MSVLRRAMRQLRWSIDVRGVSGTALLMARRALGQDPGAKPKETLVHPFDVTYGVETSGRIGGSQLGAGHAHDVYNVAYQGTPPSRLQSALAQWQALPGVRPIGEYAFFDIGCGKGRAVMMASAMGFREVGGVELDPELARVGQRNLAAWRETGEARCAVTILEGDATEVPLPALPCVLWMYNPFRGPVVRKMMERLERHAAERDGEMWLLYLIPNEAVQIEAFPRFRQRWEGMVPMSGEDQRWEDSDAEDAAKFYQR